MLFRTEDCSNHYFWNGVTVILVSVAGTDKLEFGEHWAYGHEDKVAEATQSKKKIFTVPNHKRRFVIVMKGTFTEEL